MHELSIATELLRACHVEVGTRGGGTIRNVTVEVGELAGVEPDLLHFAWDAVVAGSPDDGATLEIRWCAARQTCLFCGSVAERQPGTWLRLCPRCDEPLRVEGGEELEITQIVFDTVTQRQETPV